MNLTHRKAIIEDVYQSLLNAFGPQGWWPADTALEMIVGAILAQNTAWRNVKMTITRLKDHKLLSLRQLAVAQSDDIKALIHATGYYNQKTKRLKEFIHHIVGQWDGDLDRFLSQPMAALRDELLGVKGIGPETADSIILYAAHQPSFVVDTYTHRVFSRHGWVPETSDYVSLRDYFMDCLQPDVELFQELHALLVKVGHLYCRKRPLCQACPLQPMLESDY